jgi:hypothetical protein
MLRMTKTNPNHIAIWLMIGVVAAVSSACGPNENILRSAENKTPAVNVPIEKSSMEQDLEAMSTADFKVIFVLRRRDGSEFDAEDRAVVRQNTAQANRRVSADNGRAVIVGSNFQIEQKSLVRLKERFLFEDHSSTADAPNSNRPN